ncbi:alanine racemase [Lacicoccus alkaliphilus]|uniref:Alanine racemase n=1 Tax=Lacicoccus alkaliphilus DSM 16010 TaxID=1123231 RepID=A0A1M7KET6_9BACL|nr:alanine racemase [Salinicoccus alkaliphilus]SHM63829.1 alanine racemase [Salinicoccus alkaliphilus DSM 16010]
MSERYYRSTLVNVDLEAVHHNYKVIQGRHPAKTFIAVVKANGYGLGSNTVAGYLADRGVGYFAVATLDEAIDLRMHGTKEKILVLGRIDPGDINKAIQHRVAVTAADLDWVREAISNVDDTYDKEVWIHIKVNTGMNRYGTKDVAEIRTMIGEINSFDRFIYEGIFSHMTSADEDRDITDQEIEAFRAIINQVERPRYVHIQNSAGALCYDVDFCNALRIGISLYGYYPSPETKAATDIRLKPSIELTARVAAIHKLAPGDSVSYGRTYTAEQEETIATLPVGYADGFIRKMSGYAVEVGGSQCPVVGRVCMDSTMARVPEGTKVGDVACIISYDADAPQSMDVYSEYVDTIPYESLTLLSRRIPRHYKGEGTDFIYNEVLK